MLLYLCPSNYPILATPLHTTSKHKAYLYKWWQNSTRCRDGVKVLWCHFHLICLVFEASIPTCTRFPSENFLWLVTLCSVDAIWAVWLVCYFTENSWNALWRLCVLLLDRWLIIMGQAWASSMLLTFKFLWHTARFVTTTQTVWVTS